MDTKYKIIKDVCFEKWFTVNDFFNSDDIKKIENVVQDIDFTDGTIVGGDSNDYRNSKIKWISFEEGWIYDKIWAWANIANDDLWHFDIEGFKDNTQYTAYKAPNGKYDWHLDILGEEINHRKISFVCGLNDNYKGGELVFKFGNREDSFKIKKGQAILFPSFYLHRVTPVTKGVKKSLVQWVSGKPYK